MRAESCFVAEAGEECLTIASFSRVVERDEVAGTRYDYLYLACMDMLEEELQPYALALALTLINMEDADSAKPKATPNNTHTTRKKKRRG